MTKYEFYVKYNHYPKLLRYDNSAHGWQHAESTLEYLLSREDIESVHVYRTIEDGLGEFFKESYSRGDLPRALGESLRRFG